MCHPDAIDVVVTSRPSDRSGQEVVAIIELRPGAEPSDEELVSVAVDRLAHYKLPNQVLRVDHVLVSAAGTADYPWARDLAAAHQDRQMLASR